MYEGSFAETADFSTVRLCGRAIHPRYARQMRPKKLVVARRYVDVR